MTLKMPDSTEIHRVNYLDAWHSTTEKKAGGWSLEMIDPKNPCGGSSNWKSSENAIGGTPGKINSINGENPDKESPELLATNALNDTTLLLSFSENITSTDVTKVVLGFEPTLSLSRLTFSGSNSVLVYLVTKLQLRTIYEVRISGLYDCSGNSSPTQKGRFGLPEAAENNDVVINEVLFDSYTGYSSDYVEIYNRSPKVLNLNNWSLCTYDPLKDTLSGCKKLTLEATALLPEGMKLMNKNNSEIQQLYPKNNPKAFLKMETLPTFSNDEGVVILINDSGVIIDRFDYNADMHNALIKDPDGVALERLDYERSTQDPTNWHSAAQTVGFGTPGLPNSQFFQSADFSSMVTLEPQTFSPDNDGFDDVLNINYELDKSGYVASISIFDAEGRKVKDLIKSQLLETKGTISWEGTSDNGLRANSGIYVIFFEMYHPDGETQQFKKAAVLAVKF